MKQFSLRKLCTLFIAVFCMQHLAVAQQQDTSICYLLDIDGRTRDHNCDFIKMALDVKFNTKEGKVLGTVKYDFKPLQYIVDTLFLNAPGIDIKKVLVDGKETKFTTNDDGLIIQFLQAMNWNKQYKLEIKYEATPRKGLYFVGWNVEEKNTNNDFYFTRKQIWTQGQLTDNRYWIPTYDDVNDKMMTETTITFDTAYTVVANGELKEKRKNTDGTYTWHYAMTKPMVPYLIMLGIDKFAYKDYKSKNGMVSRQYYYSDRPQVVGPTYQYSAEMMDWLPEAIGVKYPWTTYANVPVQDFMFGAMENTTATVFGDFLQNDERMAIERGYIGVNAHELTHQWFGDYITEYNSTSHWLHESFATYYSKQFMRTVLGEESYQWGRRGEANGSVNADKNDRYPVAHSKGGSTRHYPKGSNVIDMLRYTVGDSVFKRSVANYLKKYGYSNVTTHDFMYAFMENGGINLDWFFDQWVYRSGFPIYKVRYEKQKDRVAFFVDQTQKVDELTGYFKMPVVFEVHFKDGSSSSKKQWISSASDTVYVSAPGTQEIDYALFDPSSNILKVMDFKKGFAELSAQALKAKYMIDRYDAVFALRDSSLEMKRSLLVSVYNKETFNGIKNEIITQLAKDKNTATIELLKKALHDKDYTVRRAVVENVDTFTATILPDVEKLLQDSSYITIEITLRKLYKMYPAKIAQYLEVVKNEMGINDNVRMAWLEISTKENLNNTGSKNQKQLVEYASNRYEFRTRARAMETLERLGYCDEELVKNLFNAALYTNSRLSGPAIKTLKSLIKTPANMELAKAQLAAGKWQDWESKILEEAVKL